MNIDKIAVFVDAVRMGSFHKAAEKYFYTPSALTRLADSIEKEVGVRIIERKYDGITLTPEGGVLFPYLEELVRQKQELLACALNLSKKRTTLTVGCYASVSTSLLPELIFAFQQAQTKVKISVVVGNSVADMKRKGAELCFADEGDRGGGNFLPVKTDDYVAVVKEGDFPEGRPLCREDFEGHTFLMPEHQNVKRWIGDFKGEVTDVIADDDAVVVSMVKKGLGSSILPYLTVKNHPRGVRLLKISPPLSRTLGFIYGDNLSPAARKFLRFLVER